MGTTTSGKEMAREMSSFVNNMGCDAEGFIEAMSREHRTLQQSFTTLCVAWLRTLATYNENQHDLRNEDSVKFAKAVMERCEHESHLRFI